MIKSNIYFTTSNIYVTLHIRGEQMKNRVKEFRFQQAMKQQELSEIVGATRQTISLIEKGEYNPSLKLCLAICYALDKTLDEVFWIGENKDEK